MQSPPEGRTSTDQPMAVDPEPEQAFLKALARGDRRAIAALTIGRRLDFDTLGDVLVEERLGVYVHARLAELGLGALLPRRVAEPIRQQHAAQQQRNLRLLALLDEVQRALTGAGVEVLVLKGLPLAQRSWGGMDRRFSFDLDLFVRRDRFVAATRLLKRLGFSGPDWVPWPERIALRLSHALELTRDDLSLDLHWTVRNRPGLRFDLAAPWAAATDCCVAGINCRVPADEDQLVMLLAGLANDLERGHHRQRSLWDIYFMIQGMAGTDWPAFCRRRADQGLAVLLPNLLALVLYRLDCHAEFPALAAFIAGDAGRLVVREPTTLDRLLGNSPQSLANRQWFARLLPLPIWRYWAWWGGTLPLRYLLGRHI
jgi:hypothetical protein